MKELSVVLVLISLISVERIKAQSSCQTSQPGLRGIFIYINDDKLSGADLSSLEVSKEVFERISREIKSNNRKPLQSSYDFLKLIDGRCDIQMSCKKEVKEVCPSQPACPSLQCPKCSCQTSIPCYPKVTTPSPNTYLPPFEPANVLSGSTEKPQNGLDLSFLKTPQENKGQDLNLYEELRDILATKKPDEEEYEFKLDERFLD